MNWHKKSSKIPQNIEELQKIILENRDLSTKETEEFLNPKYPGDFTLLELGINKEAFDASIRLIKKTIKADKKIVIFGDYDVDGICASAILWQVLFDLYRKEHPSGLNHPVPFIPHRERHGYGITKLAIDEIIVAHAPQLIVTVDNGIVAHEPISHAQNKGINVIVTDHHQPESKKNLKTKKDEVVLPPANSIVHTTKLCGATVAWILAKSLDEDLTSKLLDLAGIATIADQVSLLGANRSFAKFGIEALKKTSNLGIIELCRLAKVDQKEVDEGSIGFILAPRINAMGRLEHGLDALRLLCTKNKKQAQDLAKLLHDTNLARQDLTKEMLSDAETQLDKTVSENIIIVFSSKYHEGILGLIAGGLSEKYHKPAIAIAIGDDIAKASARSVFGVNIVELLREIREDLVTVGGHPMAAGFSFLPKNIDKICSKLFKLSNTRIKKSQLEKALELDCKIPVSLVNISTIEALKKFAPYGSKNSQPVFEIDNLKVLETRNIGKNAEHIKLKVQDSNDKTTISFDCLGWRMTDCYKKIKEKTVINIVATLEINDWGNKKYPQAIIKDIKIS